VNHILLHVLRKKAPFNAHGFGPGSKTVVNGRQTTRQLNRPSPKIAVSRWPRDGETIEDMEVDMYLHKTPRIPVERNGTHYPKQVSLVFFDTNRPDKMRRRIRDENVRRNEGHNNCPTVCSIRDIPEDDPGMKTR
jgi:hypothetical protein